MKIKYQLKGDSLLYDSKQELTAYNYRKNPKWIENNTIEVDVESDDYILRNIPKEFHAAFKWYAYDRSHSSGEDEIRWTLIELVDTFEEPIKKFEERIVSNYE